VLCNGQRNHSAITGSATVVGPVTRRAGNFSKIDPSQVDPSTGENYLVQGWIQTQNVPMTLGGYDKNNIGQPVLQLKQYSGVLVWQDIRNSTVVYDDLGNVTKCYVGCTSTPTRTTWPTT
jgi:hypothetical protein